MKVLVLNMDYTPINITTLQRGFKLVFKGKAEIVTHEEKSPIKTERTTFKRPTVIRLLRYITVPFRKVNLNRQNIFRRDDHKCVYCRTTHNLTVDHVIPRSKGGPNTWDNLIACCGECNIKKGDKDLSEFLSENGLSIHHTAFRPTFLYFVEKINKVSDDWKQFVGIVKD